MLIKILAMKGKKKEKYNNQIYLKKKTSERKENTLYLSRLHNLICILYI